MFPLSMFSKLHLKANYLNAKVFIQQESENSTLTAGTGYLAGRGNSPPGGGRTDWLRPHGNCERSRKRLTLQLVQLVVTQINRRLNGQTREQRKRSPRSTLHKEINIGIENIIVLYYIIIMVMLFLNINQIIYIRFICVTWPAVKSIKLKASLAFSSSFKIGFTTVYRLRYYLPN